MWHRKNTSSIATHGVTLDGGFGVADFIEALVDGAAKALLNDVDVVVVHNLDENKNKIKNKKRTKY